MVARHRTDSAAKNILADHGRCPQLAPGELIDLARRVQAGRLPDGGLTDDARAARDIIIRANLPLAVTFASGKWSRGEDPYDDLLDAGLSGLVQAAERYDPDRAGHNGRRASFSTLALIWFRKELNEIREGRAIVGTPRYLLADMARVRAAVRDGRLTPHDATSPAAIARHLGLKPAVAASVVMGLSNARATGAVVSIVPRERDKSRNRCQGKGEIYDVADMRSARPGDADLIAGCEASLAVAELVGRLAKVQPRLVEFVGLRFGLDGSPPLSWGEIAAMWGKKRETIRNMEEMAIGYLRAFARGGPIPRSQREAARWYRAEKRAALAESA